MTMQPDYLVMGMSAETFWDGVEGNRQFVAQIKELSGGLDVATGAEACERALQLFGARKIGVVTPYTPIGDANVRTFFTELGFEVKARLDTPVDVLYYKNGGILQTVLRNMMKS